MVKTIELKAQPSKWFTFNETLCVFEKVMSREVTQKIEITQEQESIFNALLSPTAIAQWWGAQSAIITKENNGIYAVSWGDNLDDPEFVTVSFIRDYAPPHGLSLEYFSYVAKSGKLPFKAKMTVHFAINPIDTSTCELEVKQKGIPNEPIADDYYNGCKIGWDQVLTNLKTFCEKTSTQNSAV